MPTGSSPVTAFQARQASTKVSTCPLSSQAPRALITLRPSGRVAMLRLEGRRLPEVERDRRAARRNGRRTARAACAARARVAEHDRVAAGLAERCVDAEPRKLAVQPFGGRAAIGRVGRIGRDRRDLQPGEQRPSEGSRSESISARTWSSWDIGTALESRRQVAKERRGKPRPRHARPEPGPAGDLDVDGRSILAMTLVEVYRRSNPPRVPRTMARPIEEPWRPPMRAAELGGEACRRPG